METIPTPEETADLIADLELELDNVTEEIEDLSAKLAEAKDRVEEIRIDLNAILDAN